MDVLEQVLIAFAFRVTFGIAAAMWVTPAGWVPAGFFRIHLWVLLGLNTLAAAVTWTAHAANSGTQRIDMDLHPGAVAGVAQLYRIGRVVIRTAPVG
ncbi:MAG: hypothetical protein KatS3mg110_0064 [Pirellulaceae bacterium]|nr:MAG: hypothetical protein KatS3mg110_0064 [Pirellulaceae bacterium]